MIKTKSQEFFIVDILFAKFVFWIWEHPIFWHVQLVENSSRLRSKISLRISQFWTIFITRRVRKDLEVFVQACMEFLVKGVIWKPREIQLSKIFVWLILRKKLNIFVTIAKLSFAQSAWSRHIKATIFQKIPLTQSSLLLTSYKGRRVSCLKS